MVGRLARGAYILTLALMIVAYALSAAKSGSQPDHQSDQPVEYWYC
jgi:hypothetical protein